MYVSEQNGNKSESAHSFASKLPAQQREVMKSINHVCCCHPTSPKVKCFILAPKSGQQWGCCLVPDSILIWDYHSSHPQGEPKLKNHALEEAEQGGRNHLNFGEQLIHSKPEI